MFLTFSFITWPFGLIFSSIPYLRIHDYKVKFFGNYIIAKACQPNFTFHLSDNGTKCLVNEDGQFLLASHSVIALILILATNVTFCLVFFQTYSNWKKKHQQLVRNIIDAECKRAVGFIVAANQSKNIAISSIEYSIVGLIYTVTYVPVCIYQLLTIFYGPPIHANTFITVAVVYDFMARNFTSIMNILFYGFFSKVFRGEMFRIAGSLRWKLQAAQRDIQQRLTNFSQFRRASDTSTDTCYTDFSTDDSD